MRSAGLSFESSRHVDRLIGLSTIFVLKDMWWDIDEQYRNMQFDLHSRGV